MLDWLSCVVRQRCPRCRQGRVFCGAIAMNERCPACGLRFEREQGYWLGALYLAYGLAVPVLSLLTAVLWVAARTSLAHSVLIALLIFLPLSPVVFRYSRILWMHLDHFIDPRPNSREG